VPLSAQNASARRPGICLKNCFELRVLRMSGATEIRTPDLLHAMERRSVHHSPPSFTTDTADQPFRSYESARVHHRSLRTVTSLVTSRPPGRRSSPEIRAVHRAAERIYRDYAGVRFPASLHAGTWAAEPAGPDHPRRTAIRPAPPVTSRSPAQCTPAVPERTPAAQATGPRGARPRSAGTPSPVTNLRPAARTSPISRARP